MISLTGITNFFIINWHIATPFWHSANPSRVSSLQFVILFSPQKNTYLIVYDPSLCLSSWNKDTKFNHPALLFIRSLCIWFLTLQYRINGACQSPVTSLTVPCAGDATIAPIRVINWNAKIDLKCSLIFSNFILSDVIASDFYQFIIYLLRISPFFIIRTVTDFLRIFRKLDSLP